MRDLIQLFGTKYDYFLPDIIDNTEVETTIKGFTLRDQDGIFIHNINIGDCYEQ